MSRLSVYHESLPAVPNKVLSLPEHISATLAELGVQFARWPRVQLPADADDAAILAAYREPLAELQATGDYPRVDIGRVCPDQADRAELRDRYLAEHRHTGVEARFFVAGQGLFSLHIADHVYEILCERGDLLVIPANTWHWFDMGERPSYVTLRLLGQADGWQAEYSGDEIASRFNRLED